MAAPTRRPTPPRGEADVGTYPGAGHAFFSDPGQRYDANAAEDARTRTLALLREQLK